MPMHRYHYYTKMQLLQKDIDIIYHLCHIRKPHQYNYLFDPDKLGNLQELESVLV